MAIPGGLLWVSTRTDSPSCWRFWKNGLEYSIAGQDVFVNVAGGLSVDEPVADLGLVVSIASSFQGRPVDSRTVLLGEVGLAGEVRAAQQVSARAREAARMGFDRIVLPKANVPIPDVPDSVEAVGVASVVEALELVF